MEIKTGKEIVSWIRGKSISEMNIKPYSKKWVSVEDVKKLLDLIAGAEPKQAQDMIAEAYCHFSKDVKK